jgi:hypothetical protein
MIIKEYGLMQNNLLDLTRIKKHISSLVRLLMISPQVNIFISILHYIFNSLNTIYET